MEYAKQSIASAQGYAQAGGYIGGAIAGASQYNGETAIRKLEVEAEMDRLASAVDILSSVTEVLCNRLDPIRRRTGSGTATNAAVAPQPVQCAVASMIRDRREAVERYTQQLQTAVSELEI